MKNINIFFNELRFNVGAIWLEDNTIKFSAPKKFQNQETSDFIKNNKNQIISVLNENRIFSKECFFDLLIIRDSTIKHHLLSPAQERLWFIEQYEEGTNAYHIPILLELDVNTDIEGIKYALRQVVSRHEVLRSTIEQHDGIGIQVVHDEPLAIEEVELTDQEDYESLLRKDINRHFNLSREYPIRTKFYKIRLVSTAPETPTTRILLLINTHHIASDGWSLVIFQRELVAYYEAYIKGCGDFNLPVMEIQYKDYAAWQRAYLTGEILGEQLNYWRSRLSGFQPLELPTDFVRPSRVDYKGDLQGFKLDRLICQKLRALAQRYGATLHSVMLSGVSILLGKYVGQDDIVIGSPTANRHHRQTEGLIGFFVNMQANRVLLSTMQSYESLIQQVQHEQEEVQLYQDMPFERLVEELGVTRDTSRHPIFQALFSMQSFSSQDDDQVQQKNYFKPFGLKNAYEVEKFDLSIFIDDYQEEFTGQISYATSLFRKDTIERLIVNFKHLLTQLVETPKKPYSQFSLLSSEEHNRIVYQWNETSRDYPRDKTISQLFQEQVERTPGNIALIYDQQRLTYLELNERSNQLARYIREQYQRRAKQPLAGDTLIALYLDRSLEMIVGVLAVLKAGGAYVPMDPTYPQERVDYIMADTCAELVLSQRHLLEVGHAQLPPEKVIPIDLTGDIYKEENISNLPLLGRAEDLAYIIYTSGTTGKPKGVMVEHHQVTSFAIGNNYISNEKATVVAGISNYAFDGSVFDMFFTLLNGKKLVLIDSNNLLDLSKLDNQLIEYSVDTIFITTALFNSLVQNEAKCLGALQQVLFGGEACSIEMVNKFKRLYGKSSLVHVYGPTENIVYSTYCKLSDYDTKSVVPIGKHLSDKKLYVLDRRLAPVPVGAIGELYIGGVGVARGYLKRPELTEERFVLNPFATDVDRVNGNTRLYKTGDMVRWLFDGNIEFIGRNDNQVKIRGFRIELGEIEHAITQVSGIKQSCVLAKERKTKTGSSKYLVGYYVLDGSDDTLTPTTILDRLSQVLPEYMVPSTLVVMGSLPLTINGKLDKRALPDPDFSQLTEGYVAPTTDLEAELCGVWREVLGLGRVGITDDFFRVGGNSILAIQVSHRMSKALSRDIKVADVFKHKTISQLLLHSVDQTQILINKTGAKQAVLSFAQERLWFIEQYQGGATAYHIPAVYELDSSTDVEGIKYALQQVVARHEVLRSTIEQFEDQTHGLQVVREEPLKIEEIDLPSSGGYEALIKADINCPFDLNREYPIRVKFYHIYPTDTNSISSVSKTLLLVNIHHIASDGWSMIIFQRELYAYYEAYINKDKDFCLPAMDIQYKDYAVWQRTYLTGAILDKQLNYWKSKLLGYQTLELPIDYARPNEIDYRGAYHGIILDRPTSQKLRTLAQCHGTTLHSVMLGGAGILLGKYTGQNDIVIGSPTANRHHQQTEGLIGFFVNTQANRLLLSSTQSYEDLIRQAHQSQMEAQLYQDLPFEKLVEELGVARDTSRHPIFQVMFSVQSFSGHINKEDRQKSYLRSFYFAGAYEIAKFDLSIHIDDSQEELQIQISYVPALFRQETIERFITHYKHLLTQLVGFPEKPYSQFSLLSPEEHQRIVYDWNKTDKDFPKDKTIYQLFQEQVERTPGNIALTHNEQSLTYLELNERSNQLAQHIRVEYQQRAKQPLVGDALIALYLDRSLEMVVGIFAVLKAGGAYIPIDTNYPQDRVDYILGDTQTELVLTQKHLYQSSQVQLPYEKVISVDLTEDIYDKEDSSNLPSISNSENLAYVIYTSGTTGKPKGATLTHRSVCNYNQWIIGHSCFAKAQILDCSSSISFDATVNVLLTPLCNGQHVVICDETIKRDTNLYVDYIQKHKIELIKVTPSYFTLLLNNIRGNNKMDYLKCIIIGGEKANKVEVEEFIRLYPAIEILHHYGPTETTVGITSFTDFSNTKLLNSLDSIPLGKVASNNQAYVLDSNKTPVPIGLIGELYIGGVSLARGYLNRPDLTEERFVLNLFTESEHSKNYFTLYKTGDLVRWLPDGNLEFIGRNDGQVKISGYRIELGEIEYALKQIQGIKQGCVIDKDRKTEGGSNKYLAAYYVLEDGNEMLTPAIILDNLSKVLPEYMMPSAIMPLESLPLNINGKLDRRALPDPNFSSSVEEYVPPTNEIETKLCQIWQEILGIDRVGVTDNFFKMGGNSILAIQLSHRMSKALGCAVKVASVFRDGSIEGLLRNISHTKVNYETVELEF